MIQFKCEGCNEKYTVPDEYAGKKVRCKKCDHVNRIPSQKNSVSFVNKDTLPDPQVSEQDYYHEQEQSSFPKALIVLISLVSIVVVLSVSFAIVHVNKKKAEIERQQFAERVDESRQQFIDTYGYDSTKLKALIDEESDEYKRRILASVMDYVRTEEARIEAEGRRIADAKLRAEEEATRRAEEEKQRAVAERLAAEKEAELKAEEARRKVENAKRMELNNHIEDFILHLQTFSQNESDERYLPKKTKGTNLKGEFDTDVGILLEKEKTFRAYIERHSDGDEILDELVKRVRSAMTYFFLARQDHQMIDFYLSDKWVYSKSAIDEYNTKYETNMRKGMLESNKCKKLYDVWTQR